MFLTLFPYNTLSTVPIGAVEGMILARNRICWSLILVRKPTILSYCNFKKTLCKRIEWYVARTNQIAAFGYVSRSNQISAFGYVSRTNKVTALGYVSRTNQITALGYACTNQSMKLEYCKILRWN